MNIDKWSWEEPAQQRLNHLLQTFNLFPPTVPASCPDWKLHKIHPILLESESLPAQTKKNESKKS